MTDRHTFYGYRIENGAAVIDREQAEKIKQIFENYISGQSLENAAEMAGLKLFHSGVKHILTNRYYLGDDYYPAIVDEETFQKAGNELACRAQPLSGTRKIQKATGEPKIVTSFSMGKILRKFDDPFEQAAYVYSLIAEEKGND